MCREDADSTANLSQKTNHSKARLGAICCRYLPAQFSAKASSTSEFFAKASSTCTQWCFLLVFPFAGIDRRIFSRRRHLPAKFLRTRHPPAHLRAKINTQSANEIAFYFRYLPAHFCAKAASTSTTECERVIYLQI